MCPASMSSTGDGIPDVPTAAIIVWLPPTGSPKGPVNAPQIGRCSSSQLGASTVASDAISLRKIGTKSEATLVSGASALSITTKFTAPVGTE